MKKRILACMLLFLCILSVCACNGQPVQPDPNTCSVTYQWQIPLAMDAPKTYTITVALGAPAEHMSLEGTKQYQLEGWYCGEKKWNFMDPVTEDILLVANWVPCSYTVSYAIDDYIRAEAIAFYGEKAGDPYAESPHRFTDLTEWQEKLDAGYVFVGWSYNGELWDFETDVVTEDMMLMATFLPADEIHG